MFVERVRIPLSQPFRIHQLSNSFGEGSSSFDGGRGAPGNSFQGHVIALLILLHVLIVGLLHLLRMLLFFIIYIYILTIFFYSKQLRLTMSPGFIVNSRINYGQHLVAILIQHRAVRHHWLLHRLHCSILYFISKSFLSFLLWINNYLYLTCMLTNENSQFTHGLGLRMSSSLGLIILTKIMDLLSLVRSSIDWYFDID